MNPPLQSCQARCAQSSNNLLSGLRGESKSQKRGRDLESLNYRHAQTRRLYPTVTNSHLVAIPLPAGQIQIRRAKSEHPSEIVKNSVVQFRRPVAFIVPRVFDLCRIGDT
jgi:hypothetical protein